MSHQHGGHNGDHQAKSHEENKRMFLHNELAATLPDALGHLDQFMEEVHRRANEGGEAINRAWDRLYVRLQELMAEQEECGNAGKLHPNWIKRILKDPEAELGSIQGAATKLFDDSVTRQNRETPKPWQRVGAVEIITREKQKHQLE